MEVIYNIDKKLRTKEEFDYLGEYLLGSRLSGTLRALLSGPWKGDRVIIVSENSWAKQRSELRRCGCESNPYESERLDMDITNKMKLTFNNGFEYYDGENAVIIGATYEGGIVKLRKADLLIEMLLVSQDRSEFSRHSNCYKGKLAGQYVNDEKIVGALSSEEIKALREHA